MTHPEYRQTSHDTEDQDELNFLAAIKVWMWLQKKTGNVPQEDYDLVQEKIAAQEDWVRNQ